MTVDPPRSTEHRQTVSLNGQTMCRSLNDAIARLNDDFGSSALMSMTISIRVVRRPDSQEIPMVFVRAETASELVSLRLPNAERCLAQTMDGTHLTLPIFDLDEGRFDECGVVALVDGRSVRNVTFKPYEPVSYDFDDVDDAITRYTLELIKASERCMRTLRHAGGGIKVFDYSKVQKTQLTDHKVLLAKLRERFPGRSDSSFRDTWKRAGFRFPRS